MHLGTPVNTGLDVQSTQADASEDSSEAHDLRESQYSHWCKEIERAYVRPAGQCGPANPDAARQVCHLESNMLDKATLDVAGSRNSRRH